MTFVLVYIILDSLRGHWFQHVTEYWSELKEQNNVHFVFYEELKKVCGNTLYMSVNIMFVWHVLCLAEYLCICFLDICADEHKKDCKNWLSFYVNYTV